MGFGLDELWLVQRLKTERLLSGPLAVDEIGAQHAGGTLLPADEPERRKATALASARFTVATAANLADAVIGLIEQGRLGTVR
jgi:hypothetical protein